MTGPLDLGTLSARVRVDSTGVKSTLGGVKRDLTDVKKNMEGTERAGKNMAVNPGVANELDRAAGSGGKLQGVMGGLRNVAPLVGLATAAGGVAAAFGDVLTMGQSYRSELNNMTAVSGATDAQMRQVSEAAKALGNDTELTATSAADAAGAMSELAKGGFTVDESMGAAKGTLQLAAAAQVDAATAATIQSQALQAFSMEAEDAARVSDILAGSANASSAEMGDISSGLQQAGTVANQFGVDIEDTATTLAMFANAGIQGSDAGTLMKSALLSLTKDSGPARDAVEALGLEVYNANGEFVGMQELFGQLDKAAESMTEEQYQAASAALFGSDAMRMSGIAAEQGAEGFDKTREAVTRTGQAAEVAAAQTEGLPGAIGAVENAWETAALEIYEKIEGPMSEGLHLVAEGIDWISQAANGPGWGAAQDVLGNLGGQISILGEAAKDTGSWLNDLLGPAASDVADKIGEIAPEAETVKSAWDSWGIPVVAAAVATLGSKFTGLSGSLNKGTDSVIGFGQEIGVQRKLAEGYGKNIGTVSGAVSVLRSRHEGLDRALGNAQGAYLRGSAGLRTIESSHKAASAAALAQSKTTTNAFDTIDRIGSSTTHSFVANTAKMGASASGLARGGMSLLSSTMGGVARGAGGLMAALGGPWGLAIMGASTAIGFLAQEHREAKQAEEEHAAQQDALKDSLDETTGSITEQTRELQLQQLQESGSIDTARGMGIAQGTLLDAVNGNAEAQQKIMSASSDSLADAISNTKEYTAAIQTPGLLSGWEEHGVSLDTFADALQGVPGAMEKVEEAGATASLDSFREQVMNSDDDVAKLGLDILGLSEDMEQVNADAAADAINNLGRQSEQTSGALEAVGDSITGIPDSKTITVSSMAPAVRDEMEELGLTVEDMPNGEVSVTFPDDMNIVQTLNGLGVQIRQLPDGRVTLSDNAPEVQQRMIDMGIAVRDEKTGEVRIKDNISEVIGKQLEMGAAVATPETGELYVKDNVGEVIASLNGLGVEAQMLPPGHVRVTDDTPEARSAIEGLGQEVVTLPGGHIAISDTSAENIAALEAAGVVTTNLPPGFIQVTDTSADNMARLDSLGITTKTLPNGQVVITDNANATRNHIKTVLSKENTNSFSDHVINITRRITDIFTSGNSEGNVYSEVKAFADGGVDRAVDRRRNSGGEPPHVAQIAPAGSYRVFAESETGGEAYIPLSESKRDRSEKILSTVASRFGYQLTNDEGEAVAFANGGVVESITGLVNRHFPELQVTSDYRNTNDLHGQGKAVDFSNGSDTTPEMQALSTWMYKLYKNQLAELIHYPLNGWKNVDEGKDYNFGAATNADHRDHVHIAAHQPLGEPAPPVGNAGLNDYSTLTGAIGAGTGKIAEAHERQETISQIQDEADAPDRELHGGSGTLLRDGSFLELMAAIYSKQTGQPMDDDIVSWGQVTGLYSKVAEQEKANSAKDVEKVTNDLASTAEKLSDKRSELPEAEEDLRIKKLKRDETYNKRDKDGKFTATESQKASADLTVTKAEQKINDLNAEIEALQAEQEQLETEQQSIYEGILNPTTGIGGTSGNRNADAIIQEGKRRGISSRGIQIALATALVESDMKMYANHADPDSFNYPHDAIGSDHDSVGLFQQRANGAWGTTADRMDPAKSAGMFYDKLDDQDYNTGDPGAHAQRVQVSAFPGRYNTRMGEAENLLSKYQSNGDPSNLTITPMEKGGILGGLNRQAQIQDGSSAVLWAEAGEEAYIPLSNKRDPRARDIWLESGKRLGYDVAAMMNLIGSGLAGLPEGDLSGFNTGNSASAERLGVNMDAAKYRGRATVDDAVNNAVGAQFYGPVSINDPQQWTRGQLHSAEKLLGQAMKGMR